MYYKNVGIDIGGTTMHMLAIHNGKYIEKTVPTGINATKEYIKKEIDKFIKSLPFKPEGLGIALPGLVRDDNFLIISDVLPNLNDLSTSYFNEDKYTIKFINDVKAATLTEAAFNKDSKTIAVLMVGTGIALGVFSDGKFNFYISAPEQIKVRSKAIVRFKVKSRETNDLYVAIGHKNEELNHENLVKLTKVSDDEYEGLVPTSHSVGNTAGFHYAYYSGVHPEGYEKTFSGDLKIRFGGIKIDDFVTGEAFVDDEIGEWYHLAGVPIVSFDNLHNFEDDYKMHLFVTIYDFSGYDYIFVKDNYGSNNNILKLIIPDLKTNEFEKLEAGDNLIILVKKINEDTVVSIKDEPELDIIDNSNIGDPVNLNNEPNLSDALNTYMNRHIILTNLQIIEISTDPSNPDKKHYTLIKDGIELKAVVDLNMVTPSNTIKVGSRVKINGGFLYKENGEYRVGISSGFQLTLFM